MTPAEPRREVNALNAQARLDVAFSHGYGPQALLDAVAFDRSEEMPRLRCPVPWVIHTLCSRKLLCLDGRRLH